MCELSHREYEGAGHLPHLHELRPRAGGRKPPAHRRQSIAAPTADGVTAAELEQAKSKVRSRIVLSSERPRGRLFAVGSDWVYRREYRPVEEDLAAVAAITVDDLAAVLRKFPLERNMTISVGPADGK